MCFHSGISSFFSNCFLLFISEFSLYHQGGEFPIESHWFWTLWLCKARLALLDTAIHLSLLFFFFFGGGGGMGRRGIQWWMGVLTIWNYCRWEVKWHRGKCILCSSRSSTQIIWNWGRHVEYWCNCLYSSMW